MSDVFVFDPNVFLSALLFKKSKPTLAYDKAKEIGHKASSQATLAELCEVFLRPKFDKYIALEGRQL